MAKGLNRVPVREQEPKVRATNFDEVCLGYNKDEAVEEAQRCLGCKNAKCITGCPVNINIPAFIAQVKEGNFEEAYKIIGESSALPAVCGRVCPQESQCEGKCVRGIKGDAVSIGKLERFVADWAKENGIKPVPAAEKNGHKIAVIGSGPAGLTCAGNTFQSLFSNPLATPDILGVTSGTCVGAILAIILSCGILETQLIALAFGLASVFFTLKIAGKNENRQVVYLVLAGVIASSLFNAIGSLLKYTADPQDKLPEITYWLMGSFTSATYKKLLIGSPLILIGIVIIYLLRWRLNILSLSEDEAKASGIHLKRTQMIFILASTVITASAVSMCGQVGWIGLLVPHCARMLVGSNNRYVVSISLSLGASFMILIDTLSRTISVIELPLSILTAIIGAPVFISLLNKNRSNLQ